MMQIAHPFEVAIGRALNESGSISLFQPLKRFFVPMYE
jgi:hypothetical protein